MSVKECTVRELFHHEDATAAWGYLSSFIYPWEALDGLKEEILRLGSLLSEEDYCRVASDVWVAKTATVAATATLCGPTIVGPHTEVRPGAFVRGSALIGRGCVVGNSTELKNCILFDGVQVPHYNYVGDSVLGYRAHLGAGAVTSNVKGDRGEVTVRVGDVRLQTGRRKCGAMVGDGAEVGCHAVLNPGSVLGVNCRVYPLAFVRGYVEAESILKREGEQVRMV